MAVQRCLCRCHQALGERLRADGVDARDPIAAVTACGECQNDHTVALLDNTESGEFLPPSNWTDEDGG